MFDDVKFTFGIISEISFPIYYLNTNIYSYLETSGSQISNLYLNAVRFFNTSVNLTSVAA